MEYGFLHPGMTHSGNKNTPYRLPTLLDDLATAWKSQNALQKMGLLPGVGDVAGFAGDVQSMVENPEERTWLNGLLSAAGLLPYVPAGMGGVIKDIRPPRWITNKISIPVGIDPTKSELKELFRESDTLRTLQSNGHLYAWPAYDALHQDIGAHFKLSPANTTHGLLLIEDLQ